MTAPIDLDRLAGELMEKAAGERAGRAARTLPHPFDGLRQTVIALRGGVATDEHAGPGPASLLVLRGQVRLVVGDDGIEIGPNQITPLPVEQHSLTAAEASVVLLSVALPARSPDVEAGAPSTRRNVGG
jgi:quercetin dioxygenase-like cupin family protein